MGCDSNSGRLLVRHTSAMSLCRTCSGRTSVVVLGVRDARADRELHRTRSVSTHNRPLAPGERGRKNPMPRGQCQRATESSCGLSHGGSCTACPGSAPGHHPWSGKAFRPLCSTPSLSLHVFEWVGLSVGLHLSRSVHKPERGTGVRDEQSAACALPECTARPQRSLHPQDIGQRFPGSVAARAACVSDRVRPPSETWTCFVATSVRCRQK